MGDKSRKNKLKKLAQHQEQKQSQHRIPPSTALIPDVYPDLRDHVKDENYKLIFQYYNHKRCELRKVADFKSLINKFNRITRSNPDTLEVRDKLPNAGNYKDLFEGLPPDIDKLEEIDYTKPGRIIFFRVKNCMCIIAILRTHR